MDFPSTIPLDKIRQPNPAYRAERMDLCQRLYDGGERFHEKIEVFLPRRDIETAQRKVGKAVLDLYASRKARARYHNRAGSMVDFMRAAAGQGDTTLEVESASQASAEYWEGLNTDADGLGKNLSALVLDMLAAPFITGRGYIGAFFASPQDQTPRLRVMTGLQVDDWEAGQDGELLWVRTRGETLTRSGPLGSVQVKQLCWTYYTPEEIVEYVSDAKGKTARRDRQQDHGFGALPIVPIRMPGEGWLIDRAFDVIRAIFERDCAAAYMLDEIAYPQRVFNVQNTDLSECVRPEYAALVIGTGEAFHYEAPPAASFDAEMKHLDYLKKAMYEVLNALALSVLAREGNWSRETALGKAMEREPLQILLRSYARPVRDALDLWIARVKAFRRDESQVTVRGLDTFTATMDDAVAAISGADKTTEKQPAEPPADDSEDAA